MQELPGVIIHDRASDHDDYHCERQLHDYARPKYLRIWAIHWFSRHGVDLVCRWSIMELWSVWFRGAHSCSASFVPGTTARRIGRLWLQRRAPLERRSRSQGLLAGFEHSQVSIAGVLSVKAFASFVFGSPVLVHSCLCNSRPCNGEVAYDPGATGMPQTIPSSRCGDHSAVF